VATIPEIRLSLVELADAAGGLDLLDAGERARAARFVRPEDADRYVRAHGALRRLLGEALGTDPAALGFSAEPSGKPRLDGGGDLRFNLSHSGGFALIGLARGVELGVDVEVERPFAVAEIAPLALAPDELEALAALPQARARTAFFDLWARKEALLKAEGSGLSADPSGFSLGLETAAQVVVRAGRRWRVQRLDTGRAGLFAAVAFEAPEGREPRLVWPPRPGADSTLGKH
jgi:4'-phosphopantetheinyl transferase